MRLGLGFVLAICATNAAAEELSGALAAAYRSNPTLEGARQAYRQAREGNSEAWSGFLPQVTLQGSAGTQLSVTETQSAFGTIRTQSANKTFEPTSESLTATQSLYEGGRRFAVLGAARSRTRAAREELRNIEHRVLLAALTAYLDVRQSQEALRLRQDNLALLDAQLVGTQDRLGAGEATVTDLSQVKARRSGAVAGLASARSDLESARAAYVAIVGEAPGDLAPPPALPVPATLDDAIAAADANPEIVAAEHGEKIAEQRVRIERSGYLPRISLNGRLARDVEPDQAGREIYSQSAVAVASIPLFDGGLARARTRSAKIGVEVAQSNTEEIRRRVRAEVTSAFFDYISAKAIVSETQEQVAANQAALDGLMEEHKLGVRTTIELLNAQQELLISQLTLARAVRDETVAEGTLLRAMGVLGARTLGIDADDIDHD